MSNPVVDMLIAERRELAELCAQLTLTQWDAPSLCEEWRVRDVVAHLLGNYHDFMALVKFPPRLQHANERQVEKRRNWPITQLVAEAAQSIKPPSVLTVGPVAAFTLYDSWVHQQDIRWPLNLPRLQDPARMRQLLKIALQVGGKQVHGTRLVANDFDWFHGTGPEIVGPSEALVMMLAQRPAAWERLEGAGVARHNSPH